ncbi:MAG: 30S ribosomal protein S4e [Nanoarchaeota archaeon]|nr:30S ribosomal protein S4e [Nanoarchaeota archaeon]
MKNHLKRIASPRTWNINRKKNKFISRPNPGAHSFENGQSLGVIIRDTLKLASTMSEAKKILNNKIVIVDGKRRRDHCFIVGIFDVISFPDLQKNYRLMMDKKGRLSLLGISNEESVFKISKIIGKTVLRGGKVQFNLYDGKNIITEQKVSVGDSLVLSLPGLEIKKVLPLKKGSFVFLTKGKHAGSSGVLKEIKSTEAVYSVDGKDVATAKEYLFVIGEKEAEIKIEN